ncbi:MAG: DUF3326 domain-containing protein, partial [Candidatus Gastranaerophilales bacterium]|nr:DUF3326 domain-containing protein [Candidatus Gastranaerophilales bacterium]
FFRGNISITPKKPYETNKIGVIFDCAIPESILNVHINTLNALKMVQGIETVGIEYTTEPVGVEIEIQNGISVGKLNNSKTLLESASKLIQKGADALAVVCFFGEDSEDENYSSGSGVDPIGGIEAVISHLIAKEFNIPVAHAPAFLDIDISVKIENPKVSSELISSTYLPCIMQGLSVAPKISKDGLIKNTNVEYLIVPYDALGSKAVLLSIENGIKIITVENETVLDVKKEKLNFTPYKHFESYEQCLKTLVKQEKRH